MPVYLFSTFEITGVGTDRGWDYSRAGSPTRDRSEMALAVPEGGVSGHAFTSSMAAISGQMAMLSTGDHLLPRNFGLQCSMFISFLCSTRKAESGEPSH